MHPHPRHTPAMPNRHNLDVLLLHRGERHLVSIGAKLHFYSCPPAHRAAFDTRSSQADELIMTASAARISLRSVPPLDLDLAERFQFVSVNTKSSAQHM